MVHKSLYDFEIDINSCDCNKITFCFVFLFIFQVGINEGRNLVNLPDTKMGSQIL